MTEQEAIAYIEEWDVTEAAKVLKWYEEDELLRPCDCDTIVAIETEELKDENAKLQEELEAAKHDLSLFSSVLVASKFENAKLRSMVHDMRYCIKRNHRCDDCDFNVGTDCLLFVNINKRMRELGVEADG